MESFQIPHWIFLGSLSVGESKKSLNALRIIRKNGEIGPCGKGRRLLFSHGSVMFFNSWLVCPVSLSVDSTCCGAAEAIRDKVNTKQLDARNIFIPLYHSANIKRINQFFSARTEQKLMAKSRFRFKVCSSIDQSPVQQVRIRIRSILWRITMLSWKIMSRCRKVNSCKFIPN